MFNLVSTLNISASNATQTITGLNCSSLMISLSARETFSSGFQIERKYLSGNVFRIRWVQGDRKGVLIPLAYEDREIFFDINSPDEPFGLELIPGRLQFEYVFKVYEKELSQAAIDFANALQVPIQLLNGLPPQLIQLLIGIDTMSSADTRNLIQSIEATSATIADNKAAQEATNAANAEAIAAVQTVTTEISEQMVINETFTLPQTAFTLQASGLYHAVMDLVQIDGTKGVQLSLTDADGEDQGFSQLISPYLGDSQKATVELTANQLASNSYPLSFLCQGRKLTAMGGTPPSQPIATNFKQLGGRANYYQLVNGTVDHSIDGVTVTDSMVMLNVTSAYMLTGNGRVYFSLNDGTYFYIDGTQPLSVSVEITQSIFESTVGFPDRVAL